MPSENNNNAASYALFPRKTTLIPYSYWLQVYMIAVIACNFGLLFWDGNGGDIGFWQDWIKQLMGKGYHDFNGNYPPVYIHWLYTVGQIYSALQLHVENNIFLKYLTQLPVLIGHMFLTGIVFQLVKKHASSAVHFHAAMLLTALNPAILFNGPIWGQIDVIPLIPVVLALLAGVSTRYNIYSFPLYCLGLLTKFQMIAFAPVFGILFFTAYKTHLKSIALCIAVFILVYLPFIIAHNFFTTFKLAYIDVLHQYGATTMGASNIWILLTGNAAPDSIVLFGIDTHNLLAPFFTAKHFGMISFSLVCILVFSQGIKNVLQKKYLANQTVLISDILFYAMICSMAFFTLLPAMHERYLLPAVILALVYFAVKSDKVFYAVAFSFISAFNLAMTMGIKTSSVWAIISWLMLFAFCYGIMELLFKRSWVIFVKDVTDKLFAFRGLFFATLIMSSLILGNHLLDMTKIRKLPLAENQIALSQLQPYFARQDFGRLHINKSINGSTLSVVGKRFENGLGTHANSQIDYLLPSNALELTFLFGLDNEIESANASFSVWGDDKLLWESRPIYGAEKKLVPITLSIKNIKRLSLRVAANGDISSDHADWIQPILSLDKH